MLVFATETQSDNPALFVLPGAFISDDSWTWTSKDILYLSETTGEITAVAPTTSTSIVRIIGYAISATEIFFDPDITYVEVA